MQMFNMSDDLARSTKFPITAYFTNLRGILGIPYQDGFVVHPRLDEAIATACSGIEVSPVCMHSYKCLGWVLIASQHEMSMSRCKECCRLQTHRDCCCAYCLCNLEDAS